MPNSELSAIDFVRELRLRQWARQHFVSSDRRKPTWHPVVLNEMSRRDQELAEEFALSQTMSAAAEADVQTVPSTKILADDEQALEPNRYLDWSHPGSAYVPLAPSGNWRFDPAEARLPKPHFGAAFVTRSEGRTIAELTALR